MSRYRLTRRGRAIVDALHMAAWAAALGSVMALLGAAWFDLIP